MIKKIMLLGMIVAAFGAIGASAASASWTMEGEEIAENEVMHLTGTMGFTAPGVGGISCSVTANLEMTAGTSTGHVTDFTVNAASCKGSGALAGCELESATTFSEPWTASSASGTTVGINGFHLKNKYKANGKCPVAETTIVDTGAADEVIGTPNNTSAISSLTMSGQASGGLVISGTLAPTEAGTWGIA